MELTTNQGMLSQLVHCVRSIISSNLDYLDCLGQQLGLQQHLDSERLSTGNFWGSKPIMVDGCRDHSGSGFSSIDL